MVLRVPKDIRIKGSFNSLSHVATRITTTFQLTQRTCSTLSQQTLDMPVSFNPSSNAAGTPVMSISKGHLRHRGLHTSATTKPFALLFDCSKGNISPD
eukprot:1159936-Pelagomonas_calceolata.AAC.4